MQRIFYRKIFYPNHICKDTWEAADGEELLCEREPHNDHDRYAVAVRRKGAVVGHLPRKTARVCSLWPLRLSPFQSPDSPSQLHAMTNWLIAVLWDLEDRF